MKTFFKPALLALTILTFSLTGTADDFSSPGFSVNIGPSANRPAPDSSVSKEKTPKDVSDTFTIELPKNIRTEDLFDIIMNRIKANPNLTGEEKSNYIPYLFLAGLAHKE